MSKPGDLVYVPSNAPILSNDGLSWEVLYPDKPGYYVVCEQREGPVRAWMESGVTTIIYNGTHALVMNKYIKKEF